MGEPAARAEGDEEVVHAEGGGESMEKMARRR